MFSKKVMHQSKCYLCDFLLECLTRNHVVESTGANIHTTLSQRVIYSTKITHWSKTLMKGIFSSVHHRTVWRPQAQIPGLATYFCLIIT